MQIDLCNIQGLRSNFSAVKSHIELSSPAILFLTETQIVRSSPEFTAPNDYRLISSFAKKHGVCAYINPKISYARAIKYEINNKHFNSVCIRLPLERSFLFIVGIYRSPNTPSSVDSFEELSYTLNTLVADHPQAQLIILGDFNVHHDKWLKCSSGIDKAGLSAELLASNFDLKQLVCEPTRIPRGNQFANTLDLVLSSCPHYSSVKVLSPLGSSDHCLVSLTLQIHPNTLPPPPPRTVFQFSKANWVELESFYKSYPWNIVSESTDLNDAVATLTDAIKLGMNLHIPVIKVRKDQKKIFSNNARIALREKHAAYKKYNEIRANKANDSEIVKEAREELRLITNKCKAIINSEDFRYLKRKTDKVLNHPNDPRFYFHTVRSLQTNFVKPSMPPLNNNGVIISDPLEKCEHFASLFASNSTISTPNSAPSFLPESDHKMKAIKIRKKIVLKYLLELNPNKATGPDGIPALILKKFAHIFAPIITKIFLISFRTGRFPDAWKSVNVQPVPKKGDKSDPSNYRPIAIISVLSKVFEKYINWHILNFVEEHNILNDCQYGFRNGRSTCDALIALTHQWNKTLEEQGETYVISLDIAKAFDTVWHANLTAKLQSYGFDPALVNLLGQFLCKRKIAVVLDGYKSNFFELNAGVPQGSPLASTLFLIYINDLLSFTSNSVLSYADDTTLHAKLITDGSETKDELDSKRECLSNTLNIDLEKIDAWSKTNLVKFNCTKTHLCVISRKKSESQAPVLMNNQALHICESLRLLGVSLSDKLNWNEHVQNLAKSAAQKLGFLARCRKFFNAEQTCRIYKSMVRPCLEYCSPVWGGASETTLSILDSIQRRASRVINDQTYSTSLHPLQHRRDVAELSLFYRYYFGQCSDELKTMVPSAKVYKRVSRSCSNAHPHTVEEEKCRTMAFQNDFFTRAVHKWNKLPAHLFASRGLNCFKSKVNKYIVKNPLPRLSKHLR